MTDVAKSSPAAAYLTKSNIVHPASEAHTAEGEAQVAAAEARARADIGLRNGNTTVSGGAIGRHR